MELRPHPRLPRATHPILVVVLDGVGIGRGDAYDAVAQADTPHLDRLRADARRACSLRAHGLAVGLPSDDDMGNSEVGHNALGSGQIVKQGAALVDRALASGALFQGAAWRDLKAAFTSGGALHFIGLLSDGGVHSRFDQLVRLLEGAAQDGARRIRVHALTDGRDVPDGSAQVYIERLEVVLGGLRDRGVDARIASGGGRMMVTMDRYESDWSIVERGWRAHVLGDARRFASAGEAVATLRAEQPVASDQTLPPFVVAEGDRPVGTIEDGDAVVFFNFRGDRALQISRAFDAPQGDFAPFDRVRVPRVVFAGMTEYDGDLHVPRRYLVEPPVIENTSGELLAAAGVRTFACSETQKYGHVTYFWNGNRSGTFDDARETFVEVPSDPPPYSERPQMKAPEIAAAAAAAIASGRYDVVRVNLANGDMVGHTGDLQATIRAVAAADAALGVMLAAVERAGGVYVVTADHGNADDMAQRDKSGAPLVDEAGRVKARTSHTLAPVPFAIGGPGLPQGVALRAPEDAGLANVAATLVELLGFAAPSSWRPSLLSID